MHNEPNRAGAGDDASPSIESIVRHTDLTCRAAVEGRRASRALVDWSRPLELSEPDIQALWCLRLAMPESIDQATLAARLALSPAQVSHTVDRLGGKGWISSAIAPNDRRRRLWRLAPLGQQTLDGMLRNHGPLRYDLAVPLVSCETLYLQRKEAA